MQATTRKIGRFSHLIVFGLLGLLLALSLQATTINPANYERQTPPLAAGQSATLLPDGRWLLLGGQDDVGISGKAILSNLDGSELTVLDRGLLHARAWHSATVLPSGQVLILGGLDADGLIVERAERFDPKTQTFKLLPELELLPRARHTTTLMTDGRMLIAGGVGDAATPQYAAELFDPQSHQVEPYPVFFLTARADHHATLLPTEPVLIWGGVDAQGLALDNAELFDPTYDRVQRLEDVDSGLLPATPLAEQPPAVAGTLPVADAQQVPTDSLIAVRFSRPMRVQTLNQDSVILIGPNGQQADIQVVPTESGMLLFLTPSMPLLPDSQYTLFLEGATDNEGTALPFSAFSFATRAIATATETSADQEIETPFQQEGIQQSPSEPTLQQQPTPAGSADWTPNARNLAGDWRIKGEPSALQELPPLQALPGLTGLAGQVLRLNGQALAGVTLAIGGSTTKSDSTGRFLLRGVPAGHQKLVIDGASASSIGKVYGRFEVGVDIVAGQTTVLPYTVWMPKLATGNMVSIPSPTTKEVVLTTPHIPGLEVHIPAGVVIRDHNGQLVSEVGITAIPIDRPPFPVPVGTRIPIYFTIQPGGAYLQGINPDGVQGARIIYPNYGQEAPGTRIDFWQYDPNEKGWYVYGQGMVTADGQQVVPDPGVAIYEFTGAMISNPQLAPDIAPPEGGCAQAGDPVDCATGLFLHSRTDLYLRDVIPVQLTRTYRPEDTRSRSFGIGTNHLYDMFLVGDFNTYQYLELVQAGGTRIRYERSTPGSGFGDTVFVHTATPSRFYGSTLQWQGSAYGPWTLTLKDGTVFNFPDSDGSTTLGAGAVTRMMDRYGNAVIIERDSSHNLSKVTSPNGRWISFTTDASSRRITQAQDNIGRTVSYSYDADGRLSQVTNVNGGIESYTYDSQHRMLTVTRPDGKQMVSNVYNAEGRISQQTLADGGIYQFAYISDAGGKITQTDVTDPRAYIRRMTFNSSGYILSETWATGTPEQQIVTLERDPLTNQILSKTDSLDRKVNFSYGTNGKVTSITRLADTPQAVTEGFSYTASFNQLASYTNPLGNIQTFTYDSFGNLTKITDPLGHSTLLSYNGSGQPTSITDANGNTTLFRYELGDLVEFTEPLGNSYITFTDPVGRPLSIMDPIGNLTQYDYDNRDSLSRITDAQGNVVALSYDLNGNLTSVTDPRGGVTSYSYDGKDRLVSRADQLGAVESFVYDGNNNLIRHVDPNGKYNVYTYDARNRLIDVKTGGGKKGQKYIDFDVTTNYSYDIVGRLTQVNDSSVGLSSYSYDGMNQLLSETSPQGSVAYNYDDNGRRTSMSVAGQPWVDYTYDAANRLMTITQGTNTVSFSYDAANRRSSLTLPNGIVASYSYDNASQLTGISYTLNSLPVGDLSYSYNALDLRTSMGGSLAGNDLPSAFGTASYNLANQLTQLGTTNFSYDANGNLLDDGINNYSWNSRNQLSGLSGSATASFRYDALGRRIEKIINGASTGFLYDGDNPVQELDGINPTANLLTGLGIDEYFLRTDASGSRSFVTDGLGSSRALADENGVLRTQYRYQPFGQVTASGESSDNSFLYTGREDDATGLYFYRARYYHPQFRRFIQSDPIGLAGGINTYGYVGGNPISQIDPLGLWSVSFEAYRGWGGGLIFGRDPSTGQLFVTGRIGLGVGGGWDWNPLAGWPGAGAIGCNSGLAAGLYGKAGGRFGPLKAGLSARGGVVGGPPGGSNQYYGSFAEPAVSLTNRGTGINASAATGIEGTIFNKGNCRCESD